MTQMFQTPQSSDDLKRAKIELAAARERGEAGALRAALARYPAHAGALVEFSAALAATGGYADVAPTPETARIAAAARERAFAAAFGAAPAMAPEAAAAPMAAFASLKALRQARKLSMKAVADRLGLGVDLLSLLEGGRIRAQSAPERLLRGLGELLDATAEQVGALLGAQPAMMPAYQRAKTGETKDGATADQLDFAEAVRMSTGMTGEQKVAWLGE